MENEVENIKSTITWLAPPYAVLIASIYLHAYWSAFDINLFEYTTLSEILLAALFPSLIYAVAAAIGLLTSYAENPKPKAQVASTNRVIEEIVPMVGVLILVLPICILMDFYWMLLLIAVAPAITFLAGLPLFQYIENRFIKVLTLILITIVPLGSFISAKSAAIQIIRGENYWAATIDDIEYRYLGHAGEKTFFTNAKNDKILILPDSDTSVSLTKVKSSAAFDSRKAAIKDFFHRMTNKTRERLIDVPIAICGLSSRNPNVLFELGNL